MHDVDQWLAGAAQATSAPVRTEFPDGIDARLAGEPNPTAWAARRDARRAMLCAGIAAVLGFTVTAGSASVAIARARPTWMSAPPSSSPYGLLVGG